MQSETQIRLLKTIAWIILLIVGIATTAFAVFSGSEDLGLWKNLPNVLPWLSLLLLTLLSWKRPVFGGLLIFLLGLFLVYFFNFSGRNFFFTTFIVTLSIPLLGFVLILCGYSLNKLEETANKTQ
ncbi:MAG: hypothetical protein AAFP76_01115 [Bacteroidota bacterium]